MNLRTKRRLRWLVPTAVVAVTAGITSASSIAPAGADPVPVLPVLTPAQLLDKVRNVQVTTLTGDVTLSSHLENARHVAHALQSSGATNSDNLK